MPVRLRGLGLTPSSTNAAQDGQDLQHGKEPRGNNTVKPLITGSIIKEATPTSTNAAQELQNRRGRRAETTARTLIQVSAIKETPVGRRGKASSKEAYAQFGFKSGFNKRFQADKDDPTRRLPEEGRGNSGGDGGDSRGGGGGGDDGSGPTATAYEAALELSEVLDWDDSAEDDLSEFQHRPTIATQAQSLFSHSFEDELRTQVMVQQWIQEEFLRTGDDQVRKRRIAGFTAESVRQTEIQLRKRRIAAESLRQKEVQARNTAIEISKASFLPTINDRDSASSEGWIWKKKVGKTLPGELLNGYDIYRWPASYQRCYVWRFNGEERLIWESEVIGQKLPYIIVAGSTIEKPRPEPPPKTAAESGMGQYGPPIYFSSFPAYSDSKFPVYLPPTSEKTQNYPLDQEVTRLQGLEGDWVATRHPWIVNDSYYPPSSPYYSQQPEWQIYSNDECKRWLFTMYERRDDVGGNGRGKQKKLPATESIVLYLWDRNGEAGVTRKLDVEVEQDQVPIQCGLWTRYLSRYPCPS